MVRAGVVGHPSEWSFSGYNKIQAPRQRYALIDYEALKELLDFEAVEKLAVTYRGWIDEALSKGEQFRDGKWTESVAVGSESFVTTSKEKLGVKGKGREVIGGDGSYELREPTASYKGILGHENSSLRLQNAYSWNEIQ